MRKILTLAILTIFFIPSLSLAWGPMHIQLDNPVPGTVATGSLDISGVASIELASDEKLFQKLYVYYWIDDRFLNRTQCATYGDIISPQYYAPSKPFSCKKVVEQGSAELRRWRCGAGRVCGTESREFYGSERTHKPSTSCLWR